jgi:hypothetical protein
VVMVMVIDRSGKRESARCAIERVIQLEEPKQSANEENIGK